MSTALVAGLVLGGALLSGNREVVFPAEAFKDGVVINVRQAPYHAKGNGRDTDTRALRKAFQDAAGTNRIVYLPVGTYLVDDTLGWDDSGGVAHKDMTLMGQSRERTILKLKDSLPRFGGTGRTAFISTGTPPGDETQKNSAFRNFILNLTVDVGSGNPGAVGIDFRGNNAAGIQDVTIKSSDREGRGRIGLALVRAWPGPALFKDIRIEGFEYGILAEVPGVAEGTLLSSTFEHIALAGQRIAGIKNNNDILSIRGLTSHGSRKALDNPTHGFITLVDASLHGTPADSFAITNGALGHMFVRNLETSGYRWAIRNRGSAIPGTSHPQFVSDSVRFLASGGKQSLGLVVEETPRYYDTAVANWEAVVPPSTPVPGVEAADWDWKNISDAIARANRAGKTTLWFPPGIYTMRKTLEVTGRIRHILGTGTTLRGCNRCPEFDLPGGPVPLVELGPGLSSDILLENLTLGYNKWAFRRQVFLEHSSPGRLILKRILIWGDGFRAYQGNSGAGDVHLENVSSLEAASGWHFAPGQKVWARQFNVEWDKGPNIVNDGADLWILGLKTEGGQTAIETRGGGRTELLGGMLKPTGRHASPDAPAFLNHESSVSLSYLDNPQPYCSHPSGPSANAARYAIQVLEVRDGDSSWLKDPLTRYGGECGPFGAFMPLYVGQEAQPRTKDVRPQTPRKPARPE